MTAKTAAAAVFALVSSLLPVGCTPTQQPLSITTPQPAAFNTLGNGPARLVAGDALGVDLHLAAAHGAVLADGS